ncbi:MAG: AMP-binding protein, partial [Alphaproteobacteria bacterium]|nr:AMP-binding protein [Alphaproteobacteria bacterium]
MRAVSLNYRDLLMVNGIYGRAPGMGGPITPFSDGCGVVEAVGEGVTRVKPGDRVATMAWNTPRHIEAWYAVMGIGAVCHTLNPRLFAEQLCYIINHAGDKVLITDATFLPILAEHRASMPTVERFIVLGEPDRVRSTGFEGALASEALIEAHDADCKWGGFDEHTACGL